MLNNQPCQKDLLTMIDEVSFAIDDMLLYLDTHPQDANALEDARNLVERRNKLLKEYARYFGPLTIDTTAETGDDSWAWVLQPWPWEVKKGRC